MSFTTNKRHHAKIGSHLDGAEDIYSLNKHTLGPGELAESEWLSAGLASPDMSKIREYRLQRVREKLLEFDCAGILLYDPVNIRYATDSTNMSIWTSHNAARYSLVMTDGPVIMFEFDAHEFLSNHNPLINEVRPAITYLYFTAGDMSKPRAKIWATEIAQLVSQYGQGNKRLALDNCAPEGIHELQSLGLELSNGEEIMELARLIKSDDELVAMRRSIFACERSIELMRNYFKPGVSEQELWGRFQMEAISRGAEWIETRLLASGPRANPWYQECSSRPMQSGELMGFDTDLVGAYGYCTDMSRTWLCGDEKPSSEQKDIYTMAYDQIQMNMQSLKPGLSFKELTLNAKEYPRNEFRHYSVLYHGVGMCDEFPAIPFSWELNENSFDGVLKPKMVLCVESYIGRRDGGPGVKLEEQILITENGYELLTSYPFESDLLL
ncbi:MAG: Xaa-Pro aminopeptidase [Candidatus Pseudothioglobus sp.]|jgi:Xaa-Pro aminopeptidase